LALNVAEHAKLFEESFKEDPIDLITLHKVADTRRL
jgi:hypothetical protein